MLPISVAMQGCAFAQGSTECTYASWTAPTHVLGLPQAIALQFGSIALGKESGYVVGLDVPNLLSTPPVPGELVAITLDGKRLPRPEGNYVFAYPRSAVDSRDRLHVVWGEPGDGTQYQDLDWVATSWKSLWHARYDPDQGWNEPREIHRREGPLAWKSTEASIEVDAADRLHVVVRHGMFDRTLAHILVDDQSQRITEVTTPFGVHTDLAVRDDRVYVAMMGWDRTTPANNANVYFVRSDDDGEHWTEPIMLEHSRIGNAREVEVVVTPEGTIHILWSHGEPGSIHPGTIRHSVSVDGGDTWSSDEIDVPDPFHYLRALTDECGEINVAYRAWEEGLDAGTGGYLQWAGEWSSPTVVNPNQRPLYVDLGMRGDGSAIVFFSVVLVDDDTGPDLRPFVTVRPVRRTAGAR